MRFGKIITIPVAAAALCLTSCDKDSPASPAPTSSTTTSVLATADVALEVLGIGAASSGQGNLLFVGIRLTESGGVGANINFARLEVFRATGELEERRELGSDDIIAGAGDNRLEANDSEEASITFFFRATVKTGRELLLTLGLTDDNGHDIEVSRSFVFS